MTELKADEAVGRVGEYIDGQAWVEERTMLQARVLPQDTLKAGEAGAIFHALNDAVVGRGAISRLVDLEARIDGALFTTYRADGVIVATATGSTGYALSAGGPVIHPQSRDILLKPVASHLSLAAALILPPESVVRFTILSDAPVKIIVDGHMECPVATGDTVEVKRSSYVARFLRANPPSYFYATLTQRLKLDPGASGARATSLRE